MSRFDTDDTINEKRKKGWGNGWRNEIYNNNKDTKSGNIFDAILEQKKEQRDNATKPKTVIMDIGDEIQTGQPRELHYNKDTHAVIPSALGIKEYGKRRKQILEEEGYHVE
jgi:hypothetical protein